MIDLLSFDKCSNTIFSSLSLSLWVEWEDDNTSNPQFIAHLSPGESLDFAQRTSGRTNRATEYELSCYLDRRPETIRREKQREREIERDDETKIGTVEGPIPFPLLSICAHKAINVLIDPCGSVSSFTLPMDAGRRPFKSFLPILRQQFMTDRNPPIDALSLYLAVICLSLATNHIQLQPKSEY